MIRNDKDKEIERENEREKGRKRIDPNGLFEIGVHFWGPL